MNFSFNRDKPKPAGRPTTPSTASVALSVAASLDPPADASAATGRQPSPDDTWEALDLSSTEYSRMRKEVMQLISDLRSLGADAMMDLPSIVVIGGQSAGKSSLVEAVSGVNVPRDSGTCTRCPIECTMSSSATTWSCRIKLRFDYDSIGRSAVHQKEVFFGPTITDKNDMDLWLRRAQAAILNPDLVPESFCKKDLANLDSVNSLKFSRNVVSIFIEDPSATDLSFVDLPGLIQNEDEEVVDLVRQLTESYISRSNTIILTTIPMTDDMQNQLSVKLARYTDPDGERTIGILTKPDMLGDGAVIARQLWLDVIEGRQHKLKHGYYCVRLPDDAQRAQRLSKSTLQRMAADYFDTTSPWSKAIDRGRFGIPAFVTDISALLVSHIKKAIPQLRQDVERLLASCLEEIGTLPKPLEDDPQIEVLARVNAFCDAFKGAVMGTSSEKGLAQRNRALYTIFTQDIRGTSPDFRPFEDPTEYFSIDTLDSEECAGVRNHEVQIMGVYDVRKIIKESIAWELPGNIPYEAKTRLFNQFTTLWSTPAEKCLTSINDVLDDVIQKLVKTHFGRFFVLQNTISDLIRPDVEEHKNKALAAVKETLGLEIIPIYSQNLSDFQDLRERWLIKYRKARRTPGVYRIPIIRPPPSSLTPNAPKSSGKGPSKPGRAPLKSGKGRSPSSLEEYPEVCDESFDTKCATALPQSLSPESQGVEECPQAWNNWGNAVPSHAVSMGVSPGVSPESQALTYLAQAGYKGLTVDDLVRLSPRDQFEDELVVMADVRAYFAIAYKRIIDHVPLKIHQTLHQALADRLTISLLQRLVVDTISTGSFADRMKELVSEDPAIEAKRIRLEAMRTRLQEMKRKLINFAA